MSRSPLALYLHIPFCDHRCAYCDFNAYAGMDERIPAYVEALQRELRLWAPAARDYEVRTVFFGGGTPSLLQPPQLTLLLNTIGQYYALGPDPEITMEMNPGTVDEGKLHAFRAAGVNRVSLGVQSLDDGELARLDRIHSARQARLAYHQARAAGFENVNLDLIYGLPYGSLASWKRTLEAALKLAPDHVSLYALTVEEGTPLFSRVRQGIEPEPDPDEAADQYEYACERMAEAGYIQYELSNWARPGYECRHNLVYWRTEPYLGFGAGAHSMFDGMRFAVVRHPQRYIELVAETPDLVAPNSRSMRHVVECEALTPKVALADTLMMGLRLNEGLPFARVQQRHGLDLRAALGPALRECISLGLLEDDPAALRLTPRGRFLSNEALVRLMGALSSSPDVTLSQSAG